MRAQPSDDLREGGLPAFAARLRDVFGWPTRRQSMDVASRFSVLRTRLMQEMGRQGWKRLGVCPMTDGAGATYVAANLALATARMPHHEVLLVDLALGNPALAVQLGLQGDPRFVPYLMAQDIKPADFMIRIESQGRLSCCLPDGPVDGGAELLQDELARERIGQLVTESQCDLAIFDLGPVLGTDEGLAALPAMDAVLLVADGMSGTGRNVADCQRLLADMPPLLGVVLNKAEIVE
ncbi:CpsD/CapB family tyrosine-protein kinase [Paracoccus sp. M683]|uniref:CpsD/CapB family tyrosine-protein kinase n=1 Tax=Paracoccus sp. M683 TaxID=2594268 RepID=UPI00117D0EB0|nr:CpsD/CapB family tyrosine-protein kinase [Paracoccus sp. M683]TRW95785.1 CpsD/CapB family tyrosine-protein kinase [Paracoccus sp. M683]